MSAVLRPRHPVLRSAMQLQVPYSPDLSQFERERRFFQSQLAAADSEVSGAGPRAQTGRANHILILRWFVRSPKATLSLR